MKIKEITWEHRNDFCAIMICEHCSNEQEMNCGYHDNYFHTKVIPAMECKSCGKKRHLDENKRVD